MLPVGIGLLSMLGAMAYSLWEPLLLGHHFWLESNPNDLWAQWRAATLLPLSGGYSHIFTFDPVLKTAPGWELLVSPIANLFSGLAYPYPFPNPHPAAWWVAGPLDLSPILLCTCAADRWLRRMDVTSFRVRAAMLAVVGVLLPPAVLWGHPEDVMALGCSLYGLCAARDGRISAGWWLGAALAFQIESVMILPLCLAVVPDRRWRSVLAKAVAVPAAVLAIPLVGDPSATLGTLLRQRVASGGIRYTPVDHLLPHHAASPVELLIVVCASLVAVTVGRHRAEIDDATLLWLAGTILLLRAFGPALYPYYLIPSLVVLCLAAAVASPARQALTLGTGLFLTGWLEIPLHGSWLRWTAVLLMLGLMSVMARPDVVAVRRLSGQRSGIGTRSSP